MAKADEMLKGETIWFAAGALSFDKSSSAKLRLPSEQAFTFGASSCFSGAGREPPTESRTRPPETKTRSHRAPAICLIALTSDTLQEFIVVGNNCLPVGPPIRAYETQDRQSLGERMADGAD